ncbi:S1 family peptidase [Ponticaulis profundi]|uniref:Serine protease n=1 Tax=Ponticaulis profundi TaxID=2665222 RepID=A0ABW1S9U5_9PROT
MKIPDWLIYLVVLAAVLYGVFSRSTNTDAPPAPPVDIEGQGSILPPPSVFDQEVMVEVDPSTTASTGTAFSLGTTGYWLTARHVVDGCTNLALAVGNRSVVPVRDYQVFAQGDLALLRTDGGPDSIEFDLETDLHVGQYGFHFGYPQGQPGEVTSRLLSRSRLTTRGRYSTSEPVLAWAESGRTRGLIGTLGGISGGPVYNVEGEVIGVTVAESPRRGRIYTTAPASVETFLTSLTQFQPEDGTKRAITLDNYGAEADRLRRNLTIIPVVCRERQ